MKAQILIAAVVLAGCPSLLEAQTPPPQGTTQTAPTSDGGAKKFRAHVLPPGAYEKLGLTADQRKQVEALESQVKASLEKILTADQLKQLANMRQQRRHGGPDSSSGADAQRPPQP